MAWCAATLRAAVPDAVVTEDAEFNQHYLLGDWMGVRTSLWEHGVKPKFLLISDAYGNPYGGKEQGFTSYSMFCADLKLDTEKLVNPGGNPGTPSALALGVNAVVSF
jgi:carbohydrate-selective porin OprB